jgi:hypothetical protein
MAPSVQEIVQEIPSVNPTKLVALPKEAPREDAAKEEAPRVKRQIEVEGGKTDAKVGDSA